MREFCESMAAASRSSPPLREPDDVRVMKRHLRVDPLDPPALLAHSQAHVRLLAGDHRLAITADRAQGCRAEQRDAAARRRIADRDVPFDIAQRVVRRPIRAPLAQSAEDRGKVRVACNRALRTREPSPIDLAIAIDGLDIGEVRVVGEQGIDAGVARACCREGGRHRQLDDRDAARTRRSDAAVARSRIDVDDVPRFDERIEAADQALAFVASDHDHADPRRRPLMASGCLRRACDGAIDHATGLPHGRLRVAISMPNSKFLLPQHDAGPRPAAWGEA